MCQSQVWWGRGRPQVPGQTGSQVPGPKAECPVLQKPGWRPPSRLPLSPACLPEQPAHRGQQPPIRQPQCVHTRGPPWEPTGAARGRVATTPTGCSRMTNAVTTSEFHPIIMRERPAMPPGRTRLSGGGRAAGTAGRREPGPCLPCPVPESAGPGTPRGSGARSQSPPVVGGVNTC